MQVNNFRADTRQGKTVFSANIGGVLTALQRDKYGWSVWIDSHGGTPDYSGRPMIIENPFISDPWILHNHFNEDLLYNNFLMRLWALTGEIERHMNTKKQKGKRDHASKQF